MIENRFKHRKSKAYTERGQRLRHMERIDFPFLEISLWLFTRLVLLRPYAAL